MCSSSSSTSYTNLLAKVLVALSLCACIAGIIFYSVDLYRHNKRREYIGWFSSAGFVLLTIPISIRLIVMHLTNWHAPHIQKYVVRIIWMIPIYSVESWIGLRFKYMHIYFEKLRESYEAYVILCFLYYLIALLGDEYQFISRFRSRSIDHHRLSFSASSINNSPSSNNHSLLYSIYQSTANGLSWMFSSLQINHNLDAAELLQRCKFGVLQYVLIKNVTAIMVCSLYYNGLYKENNFRFDNIYLYQCFITNVSQLWALYCLVQFYAVTKEELAPWRPVGKFICVKTVVFFTWWQSLLIELVLSNNRDTLTMKIPEESTWTVNEISKGLQDYLICIEMFFASIAFTIAFTPKDYSSPKLKRDGFDEESKPFLSAFLQSSLPDDLYADIKRWTIGFIPSSFVNGNGSHSPSTPTSMNISNNMTIPSTANVIMPSPFIEGVEMKLLDDQKLDERHLSDCDETSDSDKLRQHRGGEI